jgi:hypothetical protein
MTHHQVVQQNFFDVPRARRDDPETSKRAADSIPLERLTRTQELVLAGLTLAPATDEELIARFRSRWSACRVSEQSIRSRRAELVRQGLVVDSGARRLTKHRQKSTVWQVAT